MMKSANQYECTECQQELALERAKRTNAEKRLRLAAEQLDRARQILLTAAGKVKVCERACDNTDA